MAIDDDRETNFDPKRRLCADGSCIGIIGADGRCTVCGGPGDEGGPDAATTTAENPDVLPADPADDADAAETAAGDDHGCGFDPQRRLCSDGSCVGVIGANNRCRVCGKPA